VEDGDLILSNLALLFKFPGFQERHAPHRLATCNSAKEPLLLLLLLLLQNPEHTGSAKTYSRALRQTATANEYLQLEVTGSVAVEVSIQGTLSSASAAFLSFQQHTWQSKLLGFSMTVCITQNATSRSCTLEHVDD
jgi:hypothetical protein